MIDNLMEQVNKTVDAAVEERAQLFGPYYASGGDLLDILNDVDKEEE